MENTIINELKKISLSGIHSVYLLGIVTQTRSEIIFYAEHNGIMKQGNTLVEEGVIPLLLVDELYKNVTAAIRNNENFDSSVTNVVVVNKNIIKFTYKDIKESATTIKKEWKKTLGL